MVEGLGAPGASGFGCQYGFEGTGQCQLLLGYHRVQSAMVLLRVSIFMKYSQTGQMSKSSHSALLPGLARNKKRPCENIKIFSSSKFFVALSSEHNRKLHL